MNTFLHFIIPTYNRHNELKSCLASIVAQTDTDWIATVIVDDEDQNRRTEIEEMLAFFRTGAIILQYSGKRYNDFGHTPREIVKQKSNADYVLLTGDDNYYMPNLVKEIKNVAHLESFKGNKPGLIYWDMVHSHYNYQYFKCEPRTHQIDMGAFCTRTDLAKQIKMGTGFAADGDFIEDFRRKFPLESKVKINKVLFVHN